MNNVDDSAIIVLIKHGPKGLDDINISYIVVSTIT